MCKQWGWMESAGVSCWGQRGCFHTSCGSSLDADLLPRTGLVAAVGDRWECWSLVQSKGLRAEGMWGTDRESRGPGRPRGGAGWGWVGVLPAFFWPAPSQATNSLESKAESCRTAKGVRAWAAHRGWPGICRPPSLGGWRGLPEVLRSQGLRPWRCLGLPSGWSFLSQHAGAQPMWVEECGGGVELGSYWETSAGKPCYLNFFHLWIPKLICKAVSAW